LKNLDTLLTYHKESRHEATTAQDSLFGDSGAPTLSKLALIPDTTANTTDQLLWEKELLGLYISGHPLDQYAERLGKRDMSIKRLKQTASSYTPPSPQPSNNKASFKKQTGKTVVIAGIIEEMKEIMTKKGDKMLFVRLADLTDTIELVVFPKVYEEFKDMLAVDNCVVIKGTFSKKDNKESVLADKIKLLE